MTTESRSGLVPGCSRSMATAMLNPISAPDIAPKNISDAFAVMPA
ncbi:hypothetical protein [Nonomuraea sp. B5E05]